MVRGRSKQGIEEPIDKLQTVLMLRGRRFPFYKMPVNLAFRQSTLKVTANPRRGVILPPKGDEEGA